METLGPMTLSVGPLARGGADSIRTPVEETLAGPGLTVISQQLVDRRIVDRLAGLRRALGSRATLRALIEHDYLVEATPLGPAALWRGGGRCEANRESLMALLRGDIDVRFDHVRGDLLHVNAVVTRGENARVCLTSANLSTSSLDKHLNWALRIDDPAAAAGCWAAAEAAWDADFRDVGLDVDVAGIACLRIGADGRATEAFVDAVAGAGSSVRFAVFNAGTNTAGVAALVDAAGRGVDVAGVVDADQGGQGWDAVPRLRAAGVDVRYYPGARTGAVGRMHHKMVAVDGAGVVLSTANLSVSALTSLEASVWVPDAGPMAAAVEAEIDRLHSQASPDPLPPVVL